MGGQVAGLNPVADIRGYYQAMVSRNLGPTAKPKARGHNYKGMRIYAGIILGVLCQSNADIIIIGDRWFIVVFLRVLSLAWFFQMSDINQSSRLKSIYS